MTSTPELIEQMSHRGDIEKILLDKIIPLEKPVIVLPNILMRLSFWVDP